MKNLLDSDGENKAIRCFLMIYGSQALTVETMKKHMEFSGFPLWPSWVENKDVQKQHLTKSAAQSWIRHLFEMEKSHS